MCYLNAWETNPKKNVTDPWDMGIESTFGVDAVNLPTRSIVTRKALCSDRVRLLACTMLLYMTLYMGCICGMYHTCVIFISLCNCVYSWCSCHDFCASPTAARHSWNNGNNGNKPRSNNVRHTSKKM